MYDHFFFLNCQVPLWSLDAGQSDPFSPLSQRA